MTDRNRLIQEYQQLLNQQQFREADLDYRVFEEQIPFLDQMAKVENSGITVFDLYKREHIYSSFNMEEIFGYDLKEAEKSGNEYFDSKVHPDDLISLTRQGITALRFIYALPVADRRKFKFQNEYRILNQVNDYVRVIEQHTVLELDRNGNFWLGLSVMDISPYQDIEKGLKSQIINLSTGAITNMMEEQKAHYENGVQLTKREAEILVMVKEGFLSKEISDSLSISVHTVNTHRQKILSKLGANNSLEAIDFALKLGLV